MNKLYKPFALLFSLAIAFTSCNQSNKDIEPNAIIELVAGISTVGSPTGVNFTTVNNVNLSTNEQFAFRLNIISPKSFQALEITKQIDNNTPQLIYLATNGYDATPYYRNRALGGQLTTTTSFNSGGYPSSFPLIQTGQAFASGYLTTSSGFVFRTGFSNGVTEKYNFKVTDSYGRESSNYLNVIVGSQNNNNL